MKKTTVHYVHDVEAEKKDAPVSVTSASDEAEFDNELDPVGLRKAFRFAVWSSVIMVRFSRKDIDRRVSDQWPLSPSQTLVFLIIIPLPLFGASTVYSVTGFSVWVVIAIIWAFCSAFAVVLYPLWESRAALSLIMNGMIKVSTHVRGVFEYLLIFASRMFIPLGQAHMSRLLPQKWLLLNV